MSSLANLKRVTFTNEMVMSLIDLYQYKGKEFHYANILKNDKEQIIKQTIAKDTFFLIKILGIEISENRLRLIINKDSEPKNKDEHLVHNLKSILSICCNSVSDFDLSPNQVITMSQRIYSEIKKVSFATKNVTIQHNLLRENKDVSKREDLDNLFQDYKRLLLTKEYELTTLVVNFYIDFINIAPLKTDNEFIGLMMIYALLFKEGFNQFAYISFFERLYHEKEHFNQLKLSANYNWKEGYSHTEPLTSFIIKILLEGYQSLDKVIRDYEFDSKLNKSDNIENTIYRLPNIFTKDDIRLKHPYVSDSTINRTLQRLRDEGKINPLGVGRSAKWIRVEQSSDHFNPYQQLDIFGVNNEN